MSRKTALAVGAFLIIVLVGCGALGYFVFTRVDAPMVATRASSSVADYRAAGLPWTVADLRTAENVAPEENAYPIFIKAATSLDEKRLRSELSRLSELSESGKPEAFFEAIEPYRASLEKAERAASLPAYATGTQGRNSNSRSFDPQEIWRSCST